MPCINGPKRQDCEEKLPVETFLNMSKSSKVDEGKKKKKGENIAKYRE